MKQIQLHKARLMKLELEAFHVLDDKVKSIEDRKFHEILLKSRKRENEKRKFFVSY